MKLPSKVLSSAKADLHASLNLTKVLQQPGHACRSEFQLWLQMTDVFIGKLEAMERAQKLTDDVKG